MFHDLEQNDIGYKVGSFIVLKIESCFLFDSLGAFRINVVEESIQLSEVCVLNGLLVERIDCTTQRIQMIDALRVIPRVPSLESSRFFLSAFFACNTTSSANRS